MTGAFDHLSPDDFSFESTSFYDTPPTQDFDAFIAANLRMVRFAYASCDGNINSMATIASDTVERMIAPQDGDTMGDYIDRLAEEARIIQAKRAFACKVTQVGQYLVAPEEERRSTNDIEGVRRAEQSGGLQQAMYWYAEEIGAIAGPLRRHGFLTIVGHRLDQVFEAPGQPSVFSNILAYA